MAYAFIIYSFLLQYCLAQSLAQAEFMTLSEPQINTSTITPQWFAQQMLAFYQTHGRKDLPWHKNSNAYRVWISEIMLQQTQVKTVIPYYQKFMLRFTSLNDLANSNLDDVLHYWQGLGYYSRARNLHKCAQILVNDFAGQFPDNLQQMQSLPGIGRSTAGAILSLAMAKPTPILDGNVKRVLARVFLVDGWYGQASVTKQLWQLSEQLTPSKHTAQFNQAMMDLGATFCSRSKPQCQQCPLAKRCLAYIQGKTQSYPHKKPTKKIPVKQTTLALTVNDDNQVQLIKRPPTGIWGGLWSLPETNHSQSATQPIQSFRHTFSHFHLDIQIIHVQAFDPKKGSQIQDNQLLAWHNVDQLTALAFPTPIKKFLFKHFQIN